MKPEDIKTTAEILNTVSGENRFYAYLQLYHGKEPKHIAQDLDITRNAVQHYITSWKDYGLIKTESRNYQFTRLGEDIAIKLQNMQRELSIVKEGVEFDIEEFSDDPDRSLDEQQPSNENREQT